MARTAKGPLERTVDALYRTAFRLAMRLLEVAYFFVRPNLRGVAVVVRVGDEILLIENSYRTGFGVPAGRIGRREPLAEAASRELFEEAGVRTRPEDLRLTGTIHVREGHAQANVDFFEIELDAHPEVVVDDREVVWGGFVALPEIREPLWPPLRAWLAERPR